VKESVVRMTRVFEAPREAVFAAWTHAKHLVHWFGPKGFTIHSCEADPRPGGTFRLCLRSPRGQDYWVRGVYREVLAPERVVIACKAEDEHGIERLEEIIDVTLVEQGGRTELRLHATARGATPEAVPMLDGMQKGWAQTVSRLDSHLKPGHER
jgi:uncharacterized protein YndB with AHSA1/START domain